MFRSINQNNIKFYLDAQDKVSQDLESSKSKDIRLLKIKKDLFSLKDQDFDFILSTVEKLIAGLIKNQDKEKNEELKKKRKPSISTEQHLFYLNNKEPDIQSSRGVKETSPI